MRVRSKSKYEINELLNTPHKAQSGLTFTPFESRWVLRHKSASINLSGAAQIIFPEEVWPYFKLALARYAASHKVASVRAIVESLNFFAASFGSDQNIMDDADFISLKPKLGVNLEYQLSRVRGFFKYWFETGIGGISKDFIDAISQLKLKGNVKGEAVKSHDPYVGAYTPIELQGIAEGLNNAYIDDQISLSSYILAYLHLQRGSRTNQIKNLRVGDFSITQKGAKVKMPRAKQRNVPFRKQFKEYPISKDLYQLIQILKNDSLDEIMRRLPDSEQPLIQQVTDDLLPVFGDWDSFARQLPLIIRAQETSEECHLSEGALQYRLLRVADIINVFSERTGEKMKLTALRFRRTLGTDIHREGGGVGAIAYALDHEDYQNAGVYVETTADVATRLDMKIGKLLAPLAQAFAGVVVRNESEAVRGDDPSSRIRTNAGSESVGTCGNFSFCGSRAPFSCYTCIKFQPWLDAPHEEILSELYEERQAILDATGDETIARQLDRTILAVEDVIQRCEQKRIEVAEVE
ncbi:site-specific integrase [uncultured Marinobacter sp.]|uniref:site-specific integrase n=1 Tax=uncultured Marinobacter sp. TaxID=187379 RepID=UPI0025D1BAA5|nr:site-specific integrase [uncultured Marinobacter sp.]